MKNKLLILLLVFPLYFLPSKGYSQTYGWHWAKSIGADVDDFAFSVTVDASEDIYMAGSFTDSSLIIDTATLVNAGGNDIVLVKYDESGNVLWSKRFGGSLDDIAHSIVTDALGNIYITGGFESPILNFDTTSLLNNGQYYSDIFITKLDSLGNVIWSKSFGGMYRDCANSVALDVSGNIYLAGYFISDTLTFGSAVLTNNYIGWDEFFITKCDPDGNVLWAKSACGVRDDNVGYLATDNSGNVYVAGNFRSDTLRFDSLTLLNNDITCNTADIFLLKYDGNGNILWAKSTGGTNWDYIGGITVDEPGNIYLTGNYSSPIITLDSVILSNYDNTGNSSDLFLAKFSNDGDFSWAVSAGGNYGDRSYSMGIDSTGYLYITGIYKSTALSFGSTTLTNTISDGTPDIFVVKYNTSGNAIWAKSAGGTGNDEAWSIATDHSGNVYIAGSFVSNTLHFDSTALLTNEGSWDMFLAKIGRLPNGINDLFITNDISVFPNPVSGILMFIIPEKATIEISNINGQVIKTSLHDSGDTSIDIGDLSSGIYIVRVKTHKEIFTKKIIKE